MVPQSSTQPRLAATQRRKGGAWITVAHASYPVAELGGSGFDIFPGKGLCPVGPERRAVVDFAKAYEDHVAAVYGFLAYRTSTREEAEDLTQLTFERALKAWARFDPVRASVHTWLLAIARNALIDEHRRPRAVPLADIENARARASGALTSPGPETKIPGVQPELAEALVRLKPREREVLALRYGADLNAAEIADLMELTVANVHQISSRGLRKLRDVLTAHQGSTLPSE